MKELILIFMPMIIVFGIFFVAVPVVRELKNKVAGAGKPQQHGGKNRTYNREVDSIHITTDAATERRRRLDQLKSLYDAGMMERDEYDERCAEVEVDFSRGNARYR